MWLNTSESSQLSCPEVAGRLRVDVRNGLRWNEADLRSQLVGLNELTVKDEEPPWKKYIEQFKNPLIMLLLGEYMTRNY